MRADHHMLMHVNRAAFSLVELSIVLVILGLLVGGILAGQSLIRAAELRTVSTDAQRHLTNLMAFRGKYRALPGDMPYAVRFWGAADGGLNDGVDGTCAALTAASTNQNTCNGNGDGLLGVSASHELFRAWQHMANAGLVEGTYTGVAGTGGAQHAVIGENVPRANYPRAGFSFLHVDPQDGVAGTRYAGNYGNTLHFGGQHGSTTVQGSVLAATDAWNVDVKMDDGRPGTGKVRTFRPSFRPNCANDESASVAQYDLQQTTTACPLIFLLR